MKYPKDKKNFKKGPRKNIVEQSIVSSVPQGLKPSGYTGYYGFIGLFLHYCFAFFWGLVLVNFNFFGTFLFL